MNRTDFYYYLQSYYALGKQQKKKIENFKAEGGKN